MFNLNDWEIRTVHACWDNILGRVENYKYSLFIDIWKLVDSYCILLNK